MLFKTAIFALIASSLVSANTTIKCASPKPTSEPISQCNAGGAQCCNTVTKATDPAAKLVLGILGIVVEGVDVLVGLNCNSIVGGNCKSQAVCCQNNQFNGLINIGCTPVSI